LASILASFGEKPAGELLYSIPATLDLILIVARSDTYALVVEALLNSNGGTIRRLYVKKPLTVA